MPITPRAGETKEEFISRCIMVEIENGKPREEAIPICITAWNNRKIIEFKENT